MIEIRSFRDLLRLFFIFRHEFKLAAIAALVIILLGAFLLPAKYESTARLLVVNIAFGVMTRAAPQLNIFAIGFPLTLVLGKIGRAHV